MNKKYKMIFMIVMALFSYESFSQSKNTHTESDFDDVKIALAFINSHIENINKMSKRIPLLTWVEQDTLTTVSFKRELKKMFDEANKVDPDYGLGFDPILDAQDAPDTGFEFDNKDIGRNIIIVKGIDWNSFKVHIKLKRTDGQWMVEGCGAVNMKN